MDSIGSRSQSFSQAGRGIYETESQRLQREVDNFTRKLEQERRRKNMLDEQCRQANRELAQKKQKLKTLTPNSVEQRKIASKMKNLENQLDQAIVKYNETLSQNKQLREAINIVRREKKSLKSVLDNLTGEAHKAEQEAKQRYAENKQCVEVTNETNNRIVALRAKHMNERDNFSSQIHDLQDRLKDDKRKQDDQFKSMTRMLMQQGSKDGQGEHVDPTLILKKRHSKWVASNKDKKKVIDQYQRNVRIIEDAFQQIREATGISDNDEIVTAFIKSEEQNQSLYNYVNLLNQDIDMLEESNKEIEKEIKMYEELGEDADNKRKEILENLQGQMDRIKSSQQQKEEQNERLRATLQKIQEPSKKMVDEFNQSDFVLSVAQKMTYDNTSFTEQNVVQFLAEIEEYINQLITFVAFKEEKENAATVMIPMEKMPNKDFNKNALHIDVPTGNELFSDEEEEEDNRVPLNLKEIKAKTLAIVERKKLIAGQK